MNKRDSAHLDRLIRATTSLHKLAGQPRSAAGYAGNAPYGPTREALRAATAAPEKERAARAKLKPDLRGYRSKLEQAYAWHLDREKQDGWILWWAYEPMRFRLADGAWFKPDFAVFTADGLELHETKGYSREAARVRIKVAAETFPFRFYVVRRAKGGGWSYERFAACADRLAEPRKGAPC